MKKPMNDKPCKNCGSYGGNIGCDVCGPPIREREAQERLARTACSACAGLRDTMAKMEYNHQYEREKMSRVIRRLVRYADRVAERHPQAVTIHGQNARVEGGIWLAEFDRQNASVEARQK